VPRARPPLVLVSGFGPFEAVDRNPSGEVALALERDPPRGLAVRAAVLPVSFARAPKEWDRAFAGQPEPALLLGLGVAKRPGFGLERWGGPGLKCVPRPDVDGHSASAYSRPGARLETTLDLVQLRTRLRARGVPEARVSRSAGGYVCERIYHHLLRRAKGLGTHGLFVHVPPLRFAPIRRQVQVLRWVLDELVAGEQLARARAQGVSRTRRG